MTEVSYSREAMRALFLLDAGERGRAIETIEKLANAMDALRDERDLAAEVAASSGKTSNGKSTNDGAKDPEAEDAEPAEAADEDGALKNDTAAEDTEAEPGSDAIRIPGTLPLGTSGNFCLAPFSQTGDFVVALDDNITVVSLIDVIDGLNEASSE